MRQRILHIVSASLAALMAAPTVAQTTVDDLVMYGIDGDTFDLIRYNFATDDHTVLGVVQDTKGKVITDCESLAFIPAGPHKGFYTSSNNSPWTRKLIELNAFNAVGTVYPAKHGDGKILGMVSYQEASGDWYLYAVTAQNMNAEHFLVRIDPATGLSTTLWETVYQYEGIAHDYYNNLYGMTDTGLYSIDLATQTETHIGDHGWTKTEALEFAFGDTDPVVEVPGVPDPAWTASGTLFSFDDNSDSLLVVNPNDGQAFEYLSSFTAIDCEGIEFMSVNNDPFGKIMVDPHD